MAKTSVDTMILGSAYGVYVWVTPFCHCVCTVMMIHPWLGYLLGWLMEHVQF